MADTSRQRLQIFEPLASFSFKHSPLVNPPVTPVMNVTAILVPWTVKLGCDSRLEIHLVTVCCCP